MEAAFDEGERMKTRKPKERIPARTRVIGLVRRKARGKAMMIAWEVKLEMSGMMPWCLSGSAATTANSVQMSADQTDRSARA